MKVTETTLELVDHINYLLEAGIAHGQPGAYCDGNLMLPSYEPRDGVMPTPREEIMRAVCPPGCNCLGPDS